MRRWARSPRVRAAVGVAAIALLAAGTWVAIDNVPPGTELRPWPIVALVVLGTPWGLLLLSAEIDLMSRLVGVRLPATTRLRVAVLGIAFNLLPLPGAAATRLDALVGAGVRVRRASGAIVTVGVVWIAVSLLFAGVALVGTSWAALAFLAGGAAAVVAVAVIVLRSLPDARPGDVARLVGLEVVFTLTTAARFALALVALDAAVPAGGAVAMAASEALAKAVGVVPGGLGLQEGLAVLFGEVAGIPAAVALLAALVDRITRLVGVLASALVVLPLERRKRVAAA